jgi:protein gp37
MALRLRAMGQQNYVNGFRVTIHEQALELPYRWKSSQTIFVNSMSDLFHENVPREFIEKVFSVMNYADWHRYQILTKRSERLLELDHFLSWASHIWMGVTVETDDQISRIDHLRSTHARLKFLSLEPLLGALPNLDLAGIDWVIVGGESGPGARPMREEWVLEIKNQCLKSRVPFFFKQWGGSRKKKTGRILDGRLWNEMPVENLSA